MSEGLHRSPPRPRGGRAALPDVAPLPSPEVAVTLWLQGTWRSGVGAGDYIGRLGVDGDAFSLLRDGGELTQSTTQTHKERAL